MIEFSIKKTDYKVGELTIEQYYRVQHLLAVDGIDAKINIVSELSGCPLNDLKLLDKIQFTTLWNSIAEHELNLNENVPVETAFTHKGVEYRLLDIGKMTIGEYADTEMIKADPNASRKLHHLMAIIYRPAVKVKGKLVAEPYDSESLEERAQLFLDLPIKYATGALNFFLLVPGICLRSTQAFSTKGMRTIAEKKIVSQMNQLIQELPDPGTEPSASSLAMMLQKLTKLQELASSLHSISSRIEKTSDGKKRSTLGRFGAMVRVEYDRKLQKYRNK